MKIVLSRKGFDSQYGGWASPILPDGRMLTLPIPATNGLVTYGELSVGDGRSYLDVMRDLRRDRNNRLFLYHRSWLPLEEDMPAHLDPDLVASTIGRLPGWCGMFG